MGIFGKKSVSVQAPPAWMTRPPQIDVEKKYDLYCHNYPGTGIVYRKIKFKGQRSLPGEGGHLGNCYCVVEQEDGSELFLNTFQIFLFCEHGVKPCFAAISGEAQ
jgi:hypothetical protein